MKYFSLAISIALLFLLCAGELVAKDIQVMVDDVTFESMMRHETLQNLGNTKHLSQVRRYLHTRKGAFRRINKYIAIYYRARHSELESLQRQLAKDVMALDPADYNILLQVLAQWMRKDSYSEALLPLAMSLSEEYHRKRWGRRLKIGGIVIGTLVAGTAALCIPHFGIIACIPVGASVGILIAAVSKVFWRPSVVLFPEFSKKIRKLIEKGKYEIEDLSPIGTGDYDDSSAIGFVGIEGR